LPDPSSRHHCERYWDSPLSHRPRQPGTNIGSYLSAGRSAFYLDNIVLVTGIRIADVRTRTGWTKRRYFENDPLNQRVVHRQFRSMLVAPVHYKQPNLWTEKPRRVRAACSSRRNSGNNGHHLGPFGKILLRLTAFPSTQTRFTLSFFVSAGAANNGHQTCLTGPLDRRTHHYKTSAIAQRRRPHQPAPPAPPCRTIK
jgi:hypothetical protein